jgi:poly(A) polymerase
MNVSGDWLSRAGTQALCAALTGAGWQALFVGGCVRNALMRVAVSDIDIATDARPEVVMDLAAAAGWRVVPTGIAHGTVTVVVDGLAHEVTTFRRDVETDGRRAVVAYSTDIAEDAGRRDFTMNALYARADGQVIDPLGGLPDLLARRVRFVGLPEARIREDYLRILRFFRFHAWYGDTGEGPDPDGLAACAALLEGLQGLSRERVGAEMRKLLSAPDPAPAVAAMARAGILLRVLPGAEGRSLPVLVHLEDGMAPDWRRRLAVLGGDADGLRLSRADAAQLASVRQAALSGDSPATMAYRFGAGVGSDAVLVRSALMAAALPAGWQDQVAKGAAAVFPLKAADLMPGLTGAALGVRLTDLEERWIASGFALGRDELLS